MCDEFRMVAFCVVAMTIVAMLAFVAVMGGRR